MKVYSECYIRNVIDQLNWLKTQTEDNKHYDDILKYWQLQLNRIEEGK